MLRATLVASFGCAVSVSQLVGGTAGTFEKIIPTPNEAGQNIYPDIPLWRHAGESHAHVDVPRWRIL